MRTLATLFILVLLCGCVHKMPMTARLTKEQALGIATDFARGHGKHLEEYQLPRVTFDALQKQWEWSVLWHRNPSAPPGGYLWILVDDKTGNAELIPSQ